jgi:hemerythrin-like domain-containing protein
MPIARLMEDCMRSELENTRRGFLTLAAGAGSALLLDACRGSQPQSVTREAGKSGSDSKKTEGDKKGVEEVTASEDLMREHGVLRRALLVYAEAAVRLRRNPGAVPPDALQNTAKLFRTFGEDYHEKKLEEAFIFPAVKAAGGPAAAYPDVLIVQHERGREITDYILSVTQRVKLGANAAPLAAVLEAFARMYQHHAAREDTIIFPAWKATVTDKQYDELSDRFEEIEHQQFGMDGFEDAVKQISEIETSLGLADIAQFTAPPPPSAK